MRTVGVAVKLITTAAFLLLLGCVSLANRKPVEVVFDAPYDTVWAICLRVANESSTVKGADKETGIFTFRQRESIRHNAISQDLGVTITKVDATHTKVTVVPRTGWAAWGGDKHIFLDEVKKRLSGIPGSP